MFAKYLVSVPYSSLSRPLVQTSSLSRVPAVASELVSLFLAFTSSGPRSSLHYYKSQLWSHHLTTWKPLMALNCFIKSKLFSMIFKAFDWFLSSLRISPHLLSHNIVCVPTTQKFAVSWTHCILDDFHAHVGPSLMPCVLVISFLSFSNYFTSLLKPFHISVCVTLRIRISGIQTPK